MSKKPIKRRYKSISKMLGDVSDDASFNQEVDRQIKRRHIVKSLFAARTAKNVPQVDIARELNCSQSRVSKIENGEDGDLSLRELEAYAKALKYDVHLVLMNRNAKGVDKVKYHAFAIKDQLDSLAKLAAGDDTIAGAIAAFFGEAFVNLVTMLQDSAKKLPKNPHNDTPYIQIEIQEMKQDQPPEPRKGRPSRLAGQSPDILPHPATAAACP